MSTIRLEIQKIIESIIPFDSIEERHKNFALNWIESGAELFRIEKPATPDPHLVSYFLLFNKCSNKVLLVDHKKALLWLPTGGHVEPDENPKTTVEREIQEELGVSPSFAFENPMFITVSTTVGLTAGHTDVSLWYVLNGDTSFEYNYDKDEFAEIRWFSPSEISYERADPNLDRFICKLGSLYNDKVAA